MVSTPTHDPLLLSRHGYYAPVPIMTVDRTGRIVDFNIAAELLMYPHLQGQRFQSATRFLAHFGDDATGDLLPFDAAGFNGRHEGESSDDPLFTGEHDFASRLRTEQFGHIELNGTAITHLEPTSGQLAGITVFWTPVTIERESLFRERLAKVRANRLTWDSYAFSYDRLMPRLPFYREVVARHIDAMQSDGIETVLDLGAGTGNVAVPLAEAGRRVTAVDISRSMLERLIGKRQDDIADRLTVVEQRAENLPHWDSASFDGVTILLALYDMSQPAQCLAEALRVLRPGGQIVITEPKRDFRLQSLIDFTDEFLREQGIFEAYRDDWARVRHANVVLDPSERSVRLTAEDIVEKLHAEGLEDIETKDSHLGNCATIWATNASNG